MSPRSFFRDPSLLTHVPASVFGLIGLLGVTLVFYWAGVTPSFSSDDYVHLSRNLHFEGLGQALGVFASPDGREYRPLVRLSLWLNDAMGQSALPFHVTNLLLHLVTTSLVFGLIRALGAAFWPALAGTALFALHPIHTTSVHFIMGRTDLLAAVFYLSSVWVGLKAYQSRRPVLLLPATLLAAAALASKEVAISLPLVTALVCLAWRLPKSRDELWRGLIYLAPVALLTLFYLIFRLSTVPESAVVGGYMQFSPIGMVSNYAQWAFALLYPLDLYPARFLMETRPFVFLAVAGPIAALCGALILAWVWPRRQAVLANPLLWLGLVWMVVTLLPMAGGNAHRWYLYLPSVGLSLVLTALCQSWAGGPWRKAGAAALAVVFLLCAVETTRQSFIWRAQHKQTEQFFEAFEAAGLVEASEVYLANVPFGYKSAFLFSFRSLEHALEQRFGKAPAIHFLSYVNLGEKTTVTATPTESGLKLRVPITPYSFYILPRAQRRFAGPVSRRIGEWTLSTPAPQPGGHLGEIRIQPRAEAESDMLPVYYYDGEQLVKYTPP